MGKQRRIETLLDLADMDVEAAVLLSAKGNRYAAFHCQQAAEKLIKALLDHRDIVFGGEHHLDVLVDKLSDGDPWKVTLRGGWEWPTWRRECSITWGMRSTA